MSIEGRQLPLFPRSMKTSKEPSVSSDAENKYDLASHGISTDTGDYKARFPDINEAKILRKIDLRVVPLLSLVYLLGFLDRVNISNAVVFGLKQDLNLQGNEFNTALVVFFVPYILFQIPSNALLKHFKPHVWMPSCIFLYGLITMFQGFTHDFSGLVAARFFLGLVECGAYPGCYYLIAMWYKRAEAQKRFSFLFGSTTFAGGFAGLLASAIGNMDGLRGYQGWRWVFILEGIATSLIAILFYFFISDFPEEVTWLSEEEKEFVTARLFADVGYSQRHDPLTFTIIIGALKDWKIIIGGFMYLGLLAPAYSYAYFAPTIIQTFGKGTINTQLLSVAPWACALVLTLLVAVLSDHLRMRYVFVVATTAIGLAGFLILLVVHDNWHVQYAALFMAAMGTFSAMPIVLCWYNTNLGGHHRRAVGSAFQTGIGCIGGIIAVFAFLPKDAPNYIPGYSVAIAFLGVTFLANTIYFLGLSWENRNRDKLQAIGVYDNMSEEEKKQMGDLSPDYRYFT